MDEMSACDGSLADAMITMADWQTGARVIEEPGMLFVIGKTRFPMPYCNAAYPTDESTDPERLLGRAAEIFADRRYFVWGRGNDGGQIGRMALARGFLSIGSEPAMLVEHRVEPPRVAGIEIARVRDARGFQEFVEVSALAYLEAGLPAGMAERLLERWEPAVQSSVVAVARAEGRPIAGALAITNAITGVGGVYWVGTVPEARRRGAADAVARFVTQASFDDGATIVTLQASVAGEPVYLRMGYREVGRYARLLSPERSEKRR